MTIQYRSQNHFFEHAKLLPHDKKVLSEQQSPKFRFPVSHGILWTEF